MPELSNCPNCDRLFVKSLRTVCEGCHHEVEMMFEKVYLFIRKRENRTAAMHEVTEATGVEETQITKFIREGRLHLAQFPNLAYACEKCGSYIREGRICLSCRGELRSGLDRSELEAAFQKRKEARQNRSATYYSIPIDKKE
ncbi:hypothetical protein JSY36_13995 [Bacillus sp. H-16]|uniref:TIGR03826 family flagellar region protein n=1 Tax=Alteribacter salitolerans TaxID=2912333 RepID=UPI00196287DE|nr:TIGR03826 family flagellar region protein [Alteribacter salitolerans]MBM7096843.1 hypothetical protein [Alteribacter salitolerans]